MKRFWYLRRHPQTIQSEVDEELRTHLDMRTEELFASGMTRADARREALQQFGDLTGTRDYCRRQDIEKEGTVQRRLMLEDLAQDLRIGLRGLLRTPMTTLIIMTTVGLGIGATTTIFAAIDAALLHPLPYTDPGALVRIYTDAPPNRFRFSAADYLALESQQTTFERVAVYNTRQMTFTDGTTAERIPGKLVTWTYFGTLGVTSRDRSRLRAVRGKAGRSGGGDRQPSILAAASRRAPGRHERDRETDPSRRRRLHRCGRAAGDRRSARTEPGFLRGRADRHAATQRTLPLPADCTL